MSARCDSAGAARAAVGADGAGLPDADADADEGEDVGEGEDEGEVAPPRSLVGVPRCVSLPRPTRTL